MLRNLSAVYHDTDDLRLARWEVTLRRRQGGVDEGWHLQLPVESQPGIRGRSTCRCQRGGRRCASRHAGLDLAYARNVDVKPVANCAPSARPRLVRRAGRAFAELFDDTVSVLDGEHIAARFRELQLVGLTHDAQLEPLVAAFVALGARPDDTPRR